MVKIIHNDMPQVRRLSAEFARVSAPRIAARRLRARIITRTRSGVDVDNSNFRGYSEQYRLWRKRNGLPIRPNLYALAVDGQHMIESLDYYSNLTTTGGTGKSLAVSAETNPRAIGNQRYRKWVGVSASDVPFIERDLVSEFNLLQLGQPLPVIDVKTPF